MKRIAKPSTGSSFLWISDDQPHPNLDCSSSMLLLVAIVTFPFLIRVIHREYLSFLAIYSTQTYELKLPASYY